MDLPPLIEDVLPDVFDDPAQHVRAQMGLSDIPDFFGGTEPDERIENPVVMGRVHLPGEELPVGI